jgi:hypothetical protein
MTITDPYIFLRKLAKIIGDLFLTVSHLKRPIYWVIVASALFSASACSLIGSDYDQNNAVRLAVYQYERQIRGKTDDLVIHSLRTEPRIKFEGQAENGGRTVWLFDLAAREYFDLLPPDRSYMYIQTIGYNDDRTAATVDVYRGDSTGYQGQTLTLERQAGNGWQVVQDSAIADNR